MLIRILLILFTFPAWSLTVDDVNAVYGKFHISYCDSAIKQGWFKPDSSFERPEATAKAMNDMLTVMPGGLELKKVFEEANRPAANFRADLDHWLQSRSGLKAITMTELRELLAKRDFPVFDNAADEAKGFISHRAYTFAVGAGFFPIGDPHDIFYHLPAFLDPQFTHALRRVAKLIFESANLPAHQLFADYVQGPARDLTVENWSFTIGNHVFVQGGVPFFKWNALVNAGGAPLGTWLNALATGPGIYNYRQFPHWNEFAKRPDVQILLRALEPALRALEDPRADSELTVRDVSGALTDLARLHSPALDMHVRHLVADNLMNLLERYWRYIRAR